ncbi:translation initiation/elongation factor MRX8 KNAG_0C05300 [Huiozyma naganishii CBS 8797]|uniref:EngB-type G domain-containing protein n=1 Tax=Huiozyma naganishii (strain ATCC MYA-139 / BCRC 22969 / CBS 8797 / KCTC 17520 / NBRC 10181 / NCYC 3082 / Yp74L-3) TaxID=1071383 RepID=J7RJD1_HUIN7|nr:hypothetical protein KNAG_0C05300 [Kazachstania naganishii CBS 8797]CCK69628.1 hypothetical protein KNAG_0C05300 [Kazachstania naganishii CBS 8797]
MRRVILSGNRALSYSAACHGYDLFKLKEVVLNSSAPAVKTSSVENEVNLGELANPSKSGGSKKKDVTRSSLRPKWASLNYSMNEGYVKPTALQLASSNRFFNTVNAKYEWSVNQFTDIPSEKARMKVAEREEIGIALPESSKNKMYKGRTGVPFELINGLPEVVFLGRSNAGKSTILNSLTTQLKQRRLVEAAKTSKKAGFTKTLNCFNIGKKFRLIDTPGYGHNSTDLQGTMTMDYLENRKELVRCYLLISGNQGFAQSDYDIIEALMAIGRPFDLIFTKMDKVVHLSTVMRYIDDKGIRHLPSLPKLIFTNSVVSQECPKRYGIDYLRYSILENCALL